MTFQASKKYRNLSTKTSKNYTADCEATHRPWSENRPYCVNSRFVAQFVRLSSIQDPTPIPIDATLLVGDWRRDWNNPTFTYKGSSLRVPGFQFNADHSGLVYIDNYNGSGSILKVQTEWVIDGLCLLIGTHDGTGYGTYTCFEQSENKISLTGQAGQFGLVRSDY